MDRIVTFSGNLFTLYKCAVFYLFQNTLGYLFNFNREANSGQDNVRRRMILRIHIKCLNIYDDQAIRYHFGAKTEGAVDPSTGSNNH